MELLIASPYYGHNLPPNGTYVAFAVSLDAGILFGYLQTAMLAFCTEDFVAHSSNVNCLALGHKSGRVLVTGGDDKKVNLWAVGKQNCIMVFRFFSIFSGGRDFSCRRSDSWCGTVECFLISNAVFNSLCVYVVFCPS